MIIFGQIILKMDVRIGRGLLLVCSTGILSLISCGRTAQSFTEVTREAGIDFLYNFGDHTYENILESSGSGITIFDYDGDGFQDLYMMNGTWLKGSPMKRDRYLKTLPTICTGTRVTVLLKR